MKRLQLVALVGVIVLGLWLGKGVAAQTEMLAPVTDQDRCAVCGMFVGKYPAWVAQLRMSDGRVVMFDGPKDMLAYYFAPEDYDGNISEIADIAVKDYYTQQWLKGREALYVIGSDVYGPMGDELVPFDSRGAAENFLKDHHGQSILAFEEITPVLVRNMRKGHKMKGHMKK